MRVGFAIPIDTREGDYRGAYQIRLCHGRIDLGMSFNRTFRYDAFMGQRRRRVYIYRVNPGSNAERAGFRAGDRIDFDSGKRESTKRR